MVFTLCLFRKIRIARQKPLHDAMANDGGRFTVTWAKPKLLERVVDSRIIRGIHVVRVPAKRCKHGREFRHRENHPVGQINGVAHNCDPPAHQKLSRCFVAANITLPDGPFLQFTIMPVITKESNRGAVRPRNGEPLREHRDLVPYRAGRDVNPR